VTFNSSANTYTIEDLRAGSPDGTDTLTGIANLQFTDGTFATSSMLNQNPTTTVNGTSGNDFIHMTGDGAASPGVGYNEITNATSANDTINGLDGNDVIYGDGGDDVLNGGTGDDVLHGGTGTNTFTGGAGNDTIIGSGGNDTAIFSGNFTDYAISYDAATNTYSILDLRSGSPDGVDTTTGVANFKFADGTTPASSAVTHGTTVGTNDGDYIHAPDAGGPGLPPFSNYAHDLAIASAGNDVIYGLGGDDWIDSGSGNDTVYGGDGNDIIYTGPGGSTPDATHSAHVYGGAGNDQITSTNVADVLDGGTGTNIFVGVQDADGNSQTTVTYADATSGITMTDSSGGYFNGYSTDTWNSIGNFLGSAFNDTLVGDDHNNTLVGNDGNDVLNGSMGNDTLTGGTGADTFVFLHGDGVDTITDFAHGVDQISLTSEGVSDFTGLQADMSQVGTDTVITFDSNDIITLKNVTMSSLTASDFVFH
jgi:Ca2+-binding RTX toxin-like protein